MQSRETRQIAAGLAPVVGSRPLSTLSMTVATRQSTIAFIVCSILAGSSNDLRYQIWHGLNYAPEQRLDANEIGGKSSP